MKKTIELILVLMTLGLYVKVAEADVIFGTPTVLGPTINTSSADAGPSISADGLELYIDGDRPGGYGSWDLWIATRPTTSDPWGEPVNLGPSLNTSGVDGAPSISFNGLELYFISNRGGGFDIWVATRATIADAWSEPVNLGTAVNSSSDDMGPSISADGLELYFASTRPGGRGRFDLWVSKRQTIYDPWGKAVHLGPNVNSSVSDNSPCISPDGLLLFFESKRPGGYGDYDIWVTMRATTNEDWGTPVNLGPTINSSRKEYIPCISPDGSQLYYIIVDHPDGFGGYDIWQTSITPIVDLNADGAVDSADMSIVVDHWGTDHSLCDIGPTWFGDGIVDVQDLVALSEYLFTEVSDLTLVAHWPLDEAEGIIARDAVGGSDDVVMGDALWQPTSGKVDGALELDGVDDCVIAGFAIDPVDPEMSSGFSIFAWIKGGGPGQTVLSEPMGTNLLMVDAAGRLITELASSGGAALLSDAIVNDGQWHRIGLVWDGSHRSLCVDGVVVAEDTQTSLEGANSGLYIGVGNDYAAGTFFSGLID
ncbi:MAG: LamG-like jellyroll fold domain-containing protein, partial [Planctomycetota bacterium]